MVAAAMALILTLGQVPTPTKLIEARLVFVTGDGIDRASTTELGRLLSEWGRWALEADESKSDLIVILSRHAIGSGTAVAFPTGTPGAPVTAINSESRAWFLTIRTPSGQTPLYSDSEQIGLSERGGIEDLVRRLRETVGGAPAGQSSAVTPSAAAGPTFPAATPPTEAPPVVAAAEPCRVFVTEEKVSPALYRTVKKVKYAKKYYGGSSHAFEGMARKGWELGADAVVAVNVNYRPGMFSWASPHAEGLAVMWNDEGRRQFSKLPGQCFEREP